MELKEVVGFFIILFVMYFGILRFGILKTLIGFSLLGALVTYSAEGSFSIISIIKGIGILLLMFLSVIIVINKNIPINFSLVLKLIFTFIFCYWMYDTFLWWGLFTGLLIGFFLFMHERIFAGILMSIVIGVTFLLAQWMGFFGIVCGIGIFIYLSPIYRYHTLPLDPWEKGYKG